MINTQRIERLRDIVLSADNHECFIERETILAEHAEEISVLSPSERYAAQFSLLADTLSTPLVDGDEFAGRMVMGLWKNGTPFFTIQDGLSSEGHITIPLAVILNRGLDGLVDDAKLAAKRIATKEASYYAHQAECVVNACRRFALRYSAAAKFAGLDRMATDLQRVPHSPAFDFHSALQSAWMMQFIMSCICGARDFAPGRLDQSLLPFYRADINAGRITREQAVEWLALFFIKFNEISGTATDNYQTQPTPCFSSKQYLTLGGKDSEGQPAFNELTEIIVEAAEMAQLPQPTLNFRIDSSFPVSAWKVVAHAASSLGPQCNFFNDHIPFDTMVAAGIDPSIARTYTFTACNRIDIPRFLHNRMCRIDVFEDSTRWFLEAISEVAKESHQPISISEAVLKALGEIATERMANENKERVNIYSDHPLFHLESLFLDACNNDCKDIVNGGGDSLRWRHAMFTGIATIADGFAAIEKIVDKEHRIKICELSTILENNYAGNDALCQELHDRTPKFGNADPDADKWARRIADTLIDAANAAGQQTGFLMMPSFYSLEHHNLFGSWLGATPDGRHTGEPISENQSPVHGTDKNGPLTLLRSVASLPLKRCICGGLNLRLSSRPSEEIVEGLIKGYFEIGGQHIGLTFATRKELEAARMDPSSYRTLMVRKTGFSEFFVALSPQEQQEIINRTEFSI